MKKLLAAASAVVLSVGIALIAVAAPAYAHDSAVSASCSSLSVTLSAYAADTAHPHSNTVAVTIDGKPATVPATTTFAQAFTQTWPLDPSVSHTYTVTVAAWDNYVYNVKKTGATDPCLAPAAPSYAEPSCTSSDGSYTVPVAEHVIYSVGNTVVTGTHPVPAGQSVTITAAAAAGYSLTGTSSWQHTFAADTGPCGQLIAPLPPVVEPIAACGTHGSLAVTPVTGVVYTFTTGNAGQTEGAYVIVASPATGYTFANAPTVTYSGTLGGYQGCQPVATPPAATDQSCSATEDSATLVSGSIQTFAQPGMSYTIHRTDAAQPDITTAGGVSPVPPGTYTVTAHGPISGRSAWTGMVVNSDLDCVQLPSHALIEGGVTPADQTCSASAMRSGTLSFDQTPGAIVYHLNGAVVDSDSLAVSPGTYVVTATPASADFQIDGPSSWTLTVAAFQGVCGDLTTLAVPGDDAGSLAYTGVSSTSIGLLALAGGVMLGGGVLMLRSRRRRS